MSRSTPRLLLRGGSAIVFAGLLIGWAIGLADATHVTRAQAGVFLVLLLLFLGTFVDFLLESRRTGSV